jgi:hypothetical protein
MEHEILDLIDRYWKFDNDQTPVSNWHDKQDLLEAVRKALRIHDVVGRSEQLKAFLTWLEKEGGSPFIDKDALLDDWLKSL